MVPADGLAVNSKRSGRGCSDMVSTVEQRDRRAEVTRVWCRRARVLRAEAVPTRRGEHHTTADGARGDWRASVAVR